MIEDRLLLAMYLDGALWLDAAGSTPSPWDRRPFGAADIITTPPVVADGVVYVGSQDGMVHAIDAETGEGLVEFQRRVGRSEANWWWCRERSLQQPPPAKSSPSPANKNDPPSEDGGSFGFGCRVAR